MYDIQHGAENPFILGLFLNSMSSVLSYNNFHWFLSTDKIVRYRNEPTFFKQLFYFLIFTIMNLGYEPL